MKLRSRAIEDCDYKHSCLQALELLANQKALHVEPVSLGAAHLTPVTEGNSNIEIQRCSEHANKNKLAVIIKFTSIC